MANKSQEEMNEITFKIIGLLDGLSLGAALAMVEREVPKILKRGHVVQVDSERIRKLISDVESHSCALP